MKEKLRTYIKADGKLIEVAGENGHFSSVRKILYQRDNRSQRRYGWIHGHRCLSCGMKSKHFRKYKCPVKHKVTKSTDDLMALRLTPKLEMGGMLEGWYPEKERQ